MSRHRIAPQHPVATLLVVGWVATGSFLMTAAGDAPAVPRSEALTASPQPRPAAVPLPSPRTMGALRSGEIGRESGTRSEPEPEPEPTVDPDEALAARLAPVVKSTSVSLSVAVLDPEDGRTASYGVQAGTTYDTASIVKVDILVALLLHAQDEGRRLTAAERAYATSMIRVSDNASADALWSAIGGAPGLDAANRRLGLTSTTAGGDGLWGLTQTTASDQLVLLSAVFGDDSASDLSAASRAYVRELMAGIAADQDWGVSAAGPATGLKNGWLPRTATGLWDINSIGRITVDGHGYLLAVLSRGSASKEAGIALVEKVAGTAVPALGKPA
ncbi:serine hydrolase [Streptomyces sp. NPDC056909]|uniref:serine hydrolase n=1 Tax=Streptomyces sp. NPDC056909 TaxID=3345963 RepID=UPI0036887D3E